MPLRRSLLCLAALIVLSGGPLVGWADAPQTVRLTILHTNDTHGHLRPFSYPETFDPGSDLARLSARRDIGGIARRATLVKQVRSERDRQVLLVDAGDVCDGTPFSTEYHGDADVAAMSAAGYDVACPGNHEFNNTLVQVRRMVASATYPVVCANVTTTADGKLLYPPYVVKTVGTAKVAFFGLLTPEAGTYPAAREGLAVASPVGVARALVPELRKQADFVVALSHLGVDEDRIVAASVDGIDAIVGGHSHTLLPYPLFIGAVPSGNPASVNGTVIVQDFEWGAMLGRLDLTLYRSDTGRWSVKAYSGRLLPVTSRLAEDPGVAAAVASYWDRIAPKYGEVVGTAAGDFAEKGPDQAQYSLVADAIREAAGADFDMENQGGVRAPLAKGPITYADLVMMDPFSNTIVTFRATGRQIKQMLLRERPAVSGIRYAVAGGQLVEAQVGGRPIDDDAIYAGATNSYMAAFLLKGIDARLDTGKGRLDALVAYIRKKGTVTPAYDGRRVIRR